MLLSRDTVAVQDHLTAKERTFFQSAQREITKKNVLLNRGDDGTLAALAAHIVEDFLPLVCVPIHLSVPPLPHTTARLHRGVLRFAATVQRNDLHGIGKYLRNEVHRSALSHGRAALLLKTMGTADLAILEKGVKLMAIGVGDHCLLSKAINRPRILQSLLQPEPIALVLKAVHSECTMLRATDFGFTSYHLFFSTWLSRFFDLATDISQCCTVYSHYQQPDLLFCEMTFNRLRKRKITQDYRWKSFTAREHIKVLSPVPLVLLYEEV